MPGEGQDKEPDKSGRGSRDSSGNGAESPSSPEPESLDNQHSGEGLVGDGRVRSGSFIPRASGPRTAQGKEKSKHNSLKHGIFSDVVVLKTESRDEYQSLLKGLQEALRPEGQLECTLVEKLSSILWRHRRMMVAEGAEIQKSIEFLKWDLQNRQREEAEALGKGGSAEPTPGLIRGIENPQILDTCIYELAFLRRAIEREGFDKDRDTAILERIYGSDQLRHPSVLSLKYSGSLWAAHLSQMQPQREGPQMAEEDKKEFLKEIDREIRQLRSDLPQWEPEDDRYPSNDYDDRYPTMDESERYPVIEKDNMEFLDEIDKELHRLESYRSNLRSIEADRMNLERLRRSIPDSPHLDRLLRYEASLERAFDRTLNQLERLQRARLGQLLPPPLKVDVSV